MFLLTCIENPFKNGSLITKTADSWAKIVAFLLLKAYFFEAYLEFNVQIHNELTMYFCWQQDLHFF